MKPLRRPLRHWGTLVRQDVIAILVVQRVLTNANRQVMVAGIAPAGPIPQVVSPHTTCGDDYMDRLHAVCTDAALRELVAKWPLVTPSVRRQIMELARGG